MMYVWISLRSATALGQFSRFAILARTSESERLRWKLKRSGNGAGVSGSSNMFEHLRIDNLATPEIVSPDSNRRLSCSAWVMLK